MDDRPSIERIYQTLIFDSSRWADFAPRDGDVFVCTSYKAGTTWTQMICALLIHQTPDLPKPLAKLSPWLDMRTAPIGEILEELESQDHRRLIKTHTALDGLPYFDNVLTWSAAAIRATSSCRCRTTSPTWIPSRSSGC